MWVQKLGRVKEREYIGSVFGVSRVLGPRGGPVFPCFRVSVFCLLCQVRVFVFSCFGGPQGAEGPSHIPTHCVHTNTYPHSHAHVNSHCVRGLGQ